MKRRRFTINDGSSLNGKTGKYVGKKPPLMLIEDDNGEIYSINSRRIVPEGYTLKTICAPNEVMTLE